MLVKLIIIIGINVLMKIIRVIIIMMIIVEVYLNLKIIFLIKGKKKKL